MDAGRQKKTKFPDQSIGMALIVQYKLNRGFLSHPETGAEIPVTTF